MRGLQSTVDKHAVLYAHVQTTPCICYKGSESETEITL